MNLMTLVHRLKMHINIGAVLGLIAWFVTQGDPL